MNTTHGKLKSSATRPRLGLALYLPSFPTARHCSSGLEGIATVTNVRCTERNQVSTSGDTQGRLLGAGVLGHRLGTLRDCMLGQLARQQKPYSSLYLPRSDSRPRSTRGHYHLIAASLPLVVVGELACLCSNPLEEIVDEGVHDAHGL